MASLLTDCTLLAMHFMQVALLGEIPVQDNLVKEQKWRSTA